MLYAAKILFAAASCTGIYIWTKAKKRQIKIRPKNSLAHLRADSTIITFDIHGVLFKADTKKIVHIIWSNKRILKVFLYLLNPRFIADLYYLIRKKTIPEEYIFYITDKYKGLSNYKNHAIAIANAQKPIANTIELVKKLKQEGYTLHIFSNIGQTIYENLASTFPDIFKHFDAVHTPKAENNYTCKPNIGAFTEYLSRYNKDQKTILFIDNRLKNIKQALRCNILGIHYKNADSLTHMLLENNII